MKSKEYKNYNEAEIHQLYTEVGWTAYTENMSALSDRLQKELPGLRGFSTRNLRNMRMFYEE